MAGTKGTTKKNILVLIENKIKGLEQLEKQKQELKGLEKPLNNVSNAMLKQSNVQGFFNKQMQRTGKTGPEIQQGMSNMGAQFNTTGNVINMGGRQFKNFNKQLDDSIAKSGKFKMENLGVMFAGMALQRTFAGLTQTAKEWMGVGEIMGVALGTVMLPAISALTEKAILPLSEALMDMPEWMQGTVGAIAILGEGAGGALMVFGQLALGISSFKLAFPGATARIVAMTASIFSLTGALTTLGVVLASVVIGSYVKGLAEYSEAWDKLGTSVENTTEILGEAGQMTRTILPPGTEEAIEIGKTVTPESVGITPTGFSPELISLGGPELPPLEKEKQEKGFFGRAIDWLTGTSYAVGGDIPRNGLYPLHQGETVLRKDQAQQANGQNITIQYTVNATNMREVESMLRESERRVTSDIRRLSR